MPVMLQRLWIQLTADRKRFGLLCAAIGVGLLLWARVIVVSNVPRTAIADEENSVADVSEDAAAGEHFQDSPSGGSEVVRVRVQLDDAPVHDPFVISTTHFPTSPLNDGLPVNAGKSEGQEAENTQDATSRRTAMLRELINRFQLEAVMNARSDGGVHVAPMAVIDGQPWRLGQRIPVVDNEKIAFELIQIKQRSVVLKFDEQTFELHMDRQGRKH